MPFLGLVGVEGDLRNGNVERWEGSSLVDWEVWRWESGPPSPTLSKLTFPHSRFGLHAARVDCTMCGGGIATSKPKAPGVRPGQYVLTSAWVKFVSGDYLVFYLKIYDKDFRFAETPPYIFLNTPGVWKQIGLLWQVTHPGAVRAGIHIGAPRGTIFDVDNTSLLIGLDLQDDIQEISEQINLQVPPSSPERLGASFPTAYVEERELQLELLLNSSQRLQALLSTLATCQHGELRLYVPDPSNPTLDNALFIPVLPHSLSGGWMQSLYGTAGRFPLSLKPSRWGAFFSTTPERAGKSLSASGDSLPFLVNGSAPTPLVVRLLCSHAAARGNTLTLTLSTPYATKTALLDLKANFPKANDALVLDFLKGTAKIVGADGVETDATELFFPQRTQLLIADVGQCSLKAEWTGSVSFSHLTVEFHTAWWRI